MLTLTRRRHERQRRQELEGIAAFGDVNELTISGHVEQQPVLLEGDYGQCACEFVLTHITTSSAHGHWERHAYHVDAHCELARRYAESWQPGQAVIVAGYLDSHLRDTLAGPITVVSILAHAITAVGQHPLLPAPIQEPNG